MLRVGEFGVSFGGVSVCCVWDSLVWVWVSEFLLCVGQFRVGLRELVCAACGRNLYRFRGVSLCCVWDSLFRVWGILCCMCESLVWVLESEFVLCVGEYGVGLEE